MLQVQLLLKLNKKKYKIMIQLQHKLKKFPKLLKIRSMQVFPLTNL
jgi:hypothetical protein